MTVGVFAGYVFVVGLIGAKLSDGGNLALSLGLTGVVAVGFQPVRERVQRFVNELMYGERDDPYVALARLGRRLESSLGADAVLPTVVETIGQTLRLSVRCAHARRQRRRHGGVRQPRHGRTPLSARASRPGRRRAPARAEAG